jgi:hypothetical protein
MALPVTNSRAAVMLMGVAVAVMLLAYGGWRWSGAARPDLATAANANRVAPMRRGRCVVAAPRAGSGAPAGARRVRRGLD